LEAALPSFGLAPKTKPGRAVGTRPIVVIKKYINFLLQSGLLTSVLIGGVHWVKEWITNKFGN
jgi:hypothetical protein